MPAQPDYTVTLVDESGEPDMSVAVVGDQVVNLDGATAGQVLTVQGDGSVAAETPAIPAAGEPAPVTDDYGFALVVDPVRQSVFLLQNAEWDGVALSQTDPSAPSVALEMNTDTGATVSWWFAEIGGPFVRNQYLGPDFLAVGGQVNVRAKTGQVASVIQLNDENGSLLFEVGISGEPRWVAANEQDTVGAAGAADAPPATPEKYLRVQDSTGTTYVVPAYKAS